MPTKRHLARIVVMQTLFETQSRTCDAQEVLMRNIREAEQKQSIDDTFASKVLDGTCKQWNHIESAIQQFAPQWPFDRMDPITRCILMIGGFELLYGNDAPAAVIMNEAIEIAKEFGGSESAKFVNGVLNAIAHRKG